MTREQAIDKVITIAEAEVGYCEKSSNKNLYDKTANAGTANYTKYGYEMHKLYPYTMDYPAPWCDAVFDWWLVQAFGTELAETLLHGFDDYTVNSAHKYKLNGEWHTSPKKGDQIFFKNSKGICHTGLVVDVYGGRVYCVEGNTSSAAGVVANGGCVARKSYAIGYAKIAGYGRPNYDLVADEATIIANDIKEYENIEEILWELNHRGIASNVDLWREYMNTDDNIYWLCRKIIHYVRTKTYTEYADEAYTDKEAILWELSHRKIVTNVDLWREKMITDSNIYWLCQKAVHYIRTQKKEI
jgi:hypothetical protein